MSELKALIFDVDGTLADTERDGHRVAFNQAFSDAGLDWYWDVELYGELLSVAGGKERIRFFIDRYRPEFPLPKFLGYDDLDGMIADLHQAKNNYFMQLVSDGHIPPRPGVVRLIKELREAGVRLAIATTSAPENVVALLKTILPPDSPDWFEVIAAGDMVPHKKPAPDIYQYVLAKLGLSPDSCLVIEDSEQGLRAATGAGLKTLVTVNDYTRHQNFADALLVLEHLGEPDQPFEAIAGAIGNAAYGDRAFLEWLHRQ